MRNSIKFKFLTGDVDWMTYGGKFVSAKQNNGDFDYWLVLDFINMEEACGRDNQGRPKYHVSLCAVSPYEAGPENVKRALDCCGWESGNTTPLMLVEMLHSYGVSAHLWQSAGNNAHKLLKEAKKEAQIHGGIMFGFAMDRAENRIGTTGWEAIKGDLDSAIRRTVASGSPEGRIMGKMHGLA